MKLISILLIAALVLVGSGLVLFTRLQDNPAPAVASYAHTNNRPETQAKSSTESVSVAQSVITDAENVPIYPDAEQVEVLPSDGVSFWRRITTYRALSPIGPVIAFYKQALQEKGWILVGEEEDSSQTGLSFSWPNDLGGLPLKLELSVQMTEVQTGTEKHTLLYLWVERTPNILNIPLYPEAEQVEVAMVTGKDGAREREISYITQAAHQDVIAYYENNMVQYGWWAEDTTNAGDRADLSFWYSRGNPESWRAGRVFITLEPLTESRTKVKVQARGTEINLLQDQQRK